MTVVEETPDGKKSTDLNDLLSTAISPKVISDLSAGFAQFNKTVASVNQVAGSFDVTKNLIKEMETATGDVKKFRDNLATVSSGFDQFNKSIQAISQVSAASSGMMKDFEGAAAGMKAFTKNVNEMNSNFDQFTKTLSSINQMTASSASMLKEFEAATVGMKAYNKNLTDLARVYQAQLDAFKKG
jgi:methyl-accepting chemotaxis protein